MPWDGNPEDFTPTVPAPEKAALVSGAATRDRSLAAPIHLRALDVARAAKEAFLEGRLSAQVSPMPTGCFYRDALGAPCAIGAALTDEQARLLDKQPASGRGTAI